ncbi:hypothetical protein D3C87_1853670 [compost metagenome]
MGVFKRKLIAVDTPESLRRNRFGTKTVLELARRDDALLRGVAALPFVQGVQWRDRSLVVSVSDPARENPQLVRAVVEAGGEVLYVREEKASLEQVYLSLTGSLRLD